MNMEEAVKAVSDLPDIGSGLGNKSLELVEPNPTSPLADKPQAEETEPKPTRELDAEGGHDPDSEPQRRREAKGSDEKPDPFDYETSKMAEVAQKEREISEMRTRYLQQTQAVEMQLAQDFQREFPDIQSLEDVAALAQTDPERFAKFQAFQMKQQIQQQSRVQAEEEQFNYLVAQEEIELEHIAPEFFGENGDDLRSQVASFALSEGYTEGELERVTARDVRMLQMAMRGKQASNSEIAKKKVRRARPVSRPGTGRNSRAENAQSAMNQLRKTGSTEDAVKALKAMRR